MEQELVLKIANEINRQIRCGVTMSIQMSWGISKRIATLYNDRVTLALKVSGLLQDYLWRSPILHNKLHHE